LSHKNHRSASISVPARYHERPRPLS
jgi:hypothetical protein